VNYRANIYPYFIQDSCFSYYFGLDEPGLCAIFDFFIESSLKDFPYYKEHKKGGGE